MATASKTSARTKKTTAAKAAPRSATKNTTKSATARKAHARSKQPLALLEELAFKKDWRSFKRGRLIKLRPGVNLLVGDQGAGKSSLIQLAHDLAKPSQRDEANKLVSVTTHPCRVVAFDFEHENPRTMSYLMEGFTQMQFQMTAKFKSHGETINALLADLERTLEKPAKRSKQPERALILLDEPDMALSPRSAYALARRFESLAAKGHQVVAAVHNPIVIASQPEVLSLEHKKWLTPDAFLAKHAAA